MIRLFLSTIGIVGGALLLSACRSAAPNASGIAPATAPTPMVVTSQEMCKQVTLSPAQRLVVRFKSTPSTGYQWSLLQESSLLQLQQSQYIAPQSGSDTSPALGTSGVYEWQFAPQQKGSTTLMFTYQRPWQPTPLYRVECHVTVEE